MTTRNNLSAPVNRAPLIKSALIGGGIALLIISFFVLTVDEPKPEWPKLWMVRPLIITPLAGTFGGTIYYLISNSYSNRGWKKVTINLLAIIVFIIILWMGTILGLDGTLWD
jgi:small neutral amino acid transporter SnatA (MarC family)